ncbi:MAG: metallophosphoesterase [Planctomycetota bacterium]
MRTERQQNLGLASVVVVLAACIAAGLITCGPETSAISDGENSQTRSFPDAPRPSRRVLPKAVKPLNSAALIETRDRSGQVRILAGGHLYGRQGQGMPRPASSFENAIPSLSDRDPDFMLALGDTFFDSLPATLLHTQRVLKRLPFPVLGVLGNHDNLPRGRFEIHFGPLWYGFQFRSVQVLVLDSEHPEFVIQGAQLLWLQKELRAVQQQDHIRAVIICCHRVIWGDSASLAVAALSSNDGPMLLSMVEKLGEVHPFRRDIRPHLESLAKSKAVLCLAGDAGAFPGRSHNVFHEQEKDSEIHFVSLGCGDRGNDWMLQIDVNPKRDRPAELSFFNLKASAPKAVPRPEMPRPDFSAKTWRKRLFPRGLPAAYLAWIEG